MGRDAEKVVGSGHAARLGPREVGRVREDFEDHIQRAIYFRPLGCALA
jgi:hypothetical protein